MCQKIEYLTLFFAATLSLLLAPAAVAQPVFYSGFRVELTDIQIVREAKEEKTIRLTLTNTGAENLVLGNTAKNKPAIQVLFEEGFESSPLADFKLAIQNKILLQPLYLPIGASKSVKNLTFSTFIADAEKEIPTKEIVLIRAGCPDLVFDSITVSEQKKNSALVAFQVRNKGNSTAILWDKKDKSALPVAILAYLSGTTNLSRAALNVGGWREKKEIPTGELAPQATLKLSIKIDLSQKTRFTKVLILCLDPYLQVEECDETNNTISTMLK